MVNYVNQMLMSNFFMNTVKKNYHDELEQIILMKILISIFNFIFIIA